jgi:hypothetical protein
VIVFFEVIGLNDFNEKTKILFEHAYMRTHTRDTYTKPRVRIIVRYSQYKFRKAQYLFAFQFDLLANIFSATKSAFDFNQWGENGSRKTDRADARDAHAG